MSVAIKIFRKTLSSEYFFTTMYGEEIVTIEKIIYMTMN